MFTKKFLLAALIVFAFVTTGSSVMTQQGEMLREEFHQSYPLAADGRVSVGNINGDVHVTGWDRDEVKVDAIKKAYRRDRLDEAKIEIRSDNSSIHIETDYPNRTQVFNDDGGHENNPAIVEYTLTVPRNARIDAIELVNGKLDIENVKGDVKASSINGRLTAHGLTGATKLSTINGNLEAAFVSLDESKPISVGSVNGNLILVLPSDANAELKAGTVHGSIRNDFGLPVRHDEYVGHDLAGQLGEGGVLIKMGNVNGGISIKHASDGRPLSRATNLLAEKSKTKLKDKDDDFDFDYDNDQDDAKSEARRAARDAAREAARARVEASRARVEARRAEIEAARAQREAEREAARAQIEAQRDSTTAQSARAQAQAEAQRARAEALQVSREATAEARRAQSETARATREVQRVTQREAIRIRTEAGRAVREAVRVELGNIDVGNSLRLVERESKSFMVTGTPRVNLQTFDGNITVHGWDKQEVQLTVNKRAASEQQMRGIQLRSTQTGSAIDVVAEFDKNFSRREAGISFTNALVNLDVYVPRSSTLRLSSGDGRLELDGVNGNLDLNTGDGRIEVRDSRGRLAARTGDGRIQVENFDGEVEARTGDGPIALNGRFGRLAANTGSGTIMLMLPGDLSAIVETDAESLDNESGLTITEEPGASKRLKRWKIGKGGTVFTLRTGEGRIILRRSGQ
ncbi:MAG: hypothetical protein QOJ64_463 [Acidobacteriota bacterium]|jgi:DUF4097 and DUF4098 domain-containing protein YvlB|nr:hypothetical protein [Acidobacteriota bacterium]